MNPKTVTFAINCAKTVIVLMTLLILYSFFEFFRHWIVDGWEEHTYSHGFVGLVCLYTWICAYPHARELFGVGQ